MSKLNILAAPWIAVPALMLGMSTLSAKAGPASAGQALAAWQLKGIETGIMRPRLLAVSDDPGMEEPMASPPAAPDAAGGAMPAGGMKDDQMAMPGGMKDDQMGVSASPAMGGATGSPMAGKGMGGCKSDKMAMQEGCKGMMPSGASPMGAGMADMAMMREMQMRMRAQSTAPLDHIEGRIAFLKAEIQINEAQAKNWDQFAQAIRAGRQHLIEAQQAIAPASGGSSSLSQLDTYEHHLSMRLDALQTARRAYGTVYAQLSSAQKQKADELVAPFLEKF